MQQQVRQRLGRMRQLREQKQQVRQLEREQQQVREQPLVQELLLSYRKQTRQRQR